MADKRGDDEDLDDCVGGVDDLDDDVAGDEVVAVLTAAKQAEELGDEVSDSRHTAAAEVALRYQITVHVIDDVANSLLAHLAITSQHRGLMQCRPNVK